MDHQGSAYFTGLTTSTDFPITPGSLQSTGGGIEYSSFVAKLNPDGSAPEFSTYLGGTANATGYGISVDTLGNSYVTGQVYGSGFTTANPLQPAWDFLNDAFVAKVNADGSSLIFATYLGGSGNDVGQGIAVDALGNVYVTGGTFSADFPTTPGALQATFGGGAYNAFVTKILLSGADTGPLASLSSPSVDFGTQDVQTASPPQNIMLTNTGAATLTIGQVSVTGDFQDASTCGDTLAAGASCMLPVTFRPTAAGLQNGTLTITDNAAGSPQTVFLAGMGMAPEVSLSATSLAFGNQGLTTTSAAQVVHLTNNGNAPLAVSGVRVTGDFSEIDNCSGSIAPGSGCDISVKFSPSSLGTEASILNIADNAAASPQLIQLAGTGVVAFSLASSPNSLTVVKGTDAATFQVSASSAFGFAGAIALSCSGNTPANCAFNPATVIPGNTSTLNVTGLAALTGTSLTFTLTGASGSQSASTPLSVLLSDFALAASPSSVTVVAGQPGTYTLMLSPINGFSQNITLGCSGAPTEATCSVSPGAITLDGAHDSAATIMVNTTARSSLMNLRLAPPCGSGRMEFLRWCVFLLALLTLVLLLAIREPTRGFGLAPCATAAGLALCLACCGGGTSGGGRPPPIGTLPGTYTMIVAASSSGGPTHSISVTLVVD